MSTTVSYHKRRGLIETYFDRTAVDAWARLTSDAPVGRIRATVRAGRTQMRDTILSWLPEDLRGARLLDAGCGTGALAVEAARRGAIVTAIDIASNRITLASERAPRDLGAGRIDFRVGDMLDPALGRFDYIVSMDALIHYASQDAVGAIATLAARADRSLVFTYAPRTPALAAMHRVGKLFPRSDRSPAIEPVAPAKLAAGIDGHHGLRSHRRGRTERISRGFYISQALELVRA